jgi:hypothetical protein
MYNSIIGLTIKKYIFLDSFCHKQAFSGKKNRRLISLNFEARFDIV